MGEPNEDGHRKGGHGASHAGKTPQKRRRAHPQKQKNPIGSQAARSVSIPPSPPPSTSVVEGKELWVKTEIALQPYHARARAGTQRARSPKLEEATNKWIIS